MERAVNSGCLILDFLKPGSDHNDILVGMIMTPLVQMPAFDFEFIQRALVRHLIAALRELGQQHVLVIEYEVMPPTPATA